MKIVSFDSGILIKVSNEKLMLIESFNQGKVDKIYVEEYGKIFSMEKEKAEDMFRKADKLIEENKYEFYFVNLINTYLPKAISEKYLSLEEFSNNIDKKIDNEKTISRISIRDFFEKMCENNKKYGAYLKNVNGVYIIIR